jgi:Flp pilus assembly protein TadD
LNDARLVFERAVLLNPNFVDARRRLGLTYALLGQPDDARKQFEEALKLEPNNEQVKVNLAALNEGRLKPATTQSTTAPG